MPEALRLAPIRPGGLGVALGHPELSAWSTDWRPKLQTLRNPVRKLPFVDSGLINGQRYFYAITAERKLKHPAVLAIVQAARRELHS